MSKVLFFAIVGLLVVTEIFAHSADNERSCGEHGDPCSQGCCDGFSCNAAAQRCQAIITEDILKEARDKLKPVEVPIAILTASNNENCGKHGDPCSQGCCDGFKCNKYAEKCMALITEDMLKEARDKLKPVEVPVSAYAAHNDDNCGRHGDPCQEGGMCCEGLTCHKYAKRCQIVITEHELTEGHSKLKNIQKRSATSGSCGKHGDYCSNGCCDGFRCNAAAGKCMAIITEDMLKEGRAKLKPVQDRPTGSVTAPRSQNSANCGKHGDNCDKGCCSGFVCNSAAGRCMATITEGMLKEGRAKLRPVNSRAIGA